MVCRVVTFLSRVRGVRVGQCIRVRQGARVGRGIWGGGDGRALGGKVTARRRMLKPAGPDAAGRPEPEPAQPTYRAELENLTGEQVDALLRDFPGALISRTA